MIKYSKKSQAEIRLKANWELLKAVKENRTKRAAWDSLSTQGAIALDEALDFVNYSELRQLAAHLN